MTEASLQALIRLALGRHARHARLFRNNCGIAFHADGSHVAYGLANPGGSDLIGWTTVTITPAMVGQRVAVFTAAEVKTEAGRVTADQRQFLDAVAAAGGLAAVLRSTDDALKLVRSA